jgi:hypothetical protein
MKWMYICNYPLQLLLAFNFYNGFEIDTLSGKKYATIAPGKNRYNEEVWFFGNKFLRIGQNNTILGTETHLIEIANPNFSFFTQSLKKSNAANGVDTSYFTIGVTIQVLQSIFCQISGVVTPDQSRPGTGL